MNWILGLHHGGITEQAEQTDNPKPWRSWAALNPKLTKDQPFRINSAETGGRRFTNKINGWQVKAKSWAKKLFKATIAQAVVKC